MKKDLSLQQLINPELVKKEVEKQISKHEKRTYICDTQDETSEEYLKNHGTLNDIPCQAAVLSAEDKEWISKRASKYMTDKWEP